MCQSCWRLRRRSSNKSRSGFMNPNLDESTVFCVGFLSAANLSPMNTRLPNLQTNSFSIEIIVSEMKDRPTTSSVALHKSNIKNIGCVMVQAVQYEKPKTQGQMLFIYPIKGLSGLECFSRLQPNIRLRAHPDCLVFPNVLNRSFTK